MQTFSWITPRLARGLMACALLAAACAPAAAPSPTAAPAKPAPQPTSAAAGPAATPAAEKPAAQATSAPAAKEARSIDALYEAARQEGKLVLYMSLSTQSQDVIPPAFEKRFPGVEVDHIDGTSDQLVARAISEARGGRTIGDIFGGTPVYIAQAREQGLLQAYSIPEMDAYPPELKGKDWLATDLQFFVTGWNTDLVAAGEEPSSIEDLADPKWKGKLIMEPRDWQVLMGLSKKYNSEQRAEEVLRGIAANAPEFHRGHSDLIELLVAGQGAVCAATCYAHHFPPRISKNAPIREMMSEGVGEIGGNIAILKGAPHPNAAMLWARWAASEEGQNVWREAGETPAHPNVDPKEDFKPRQVYLLGAEEIATEAARFEAKWKEIFGIR